MSKLAQEIATVFCKITQIHISFLIKAHTPLH